MIEVWAKSAWYTCWTYEICCWETPWW